MRLNEFKQTVFITHEETNLCHVQVTAWDHCNPWQLSFIINGKRVIDRQTVDYTDRTQIYLPLVEEETPCVIELYAFMETPVSYRLTLKPVKKWKVRILLSSHEDLGYCAYVNQLGKSCTDYLCRAMDIMDRDPEYRYMIEHYWWLRNFEIYASDTDKARLNKYLHSGNIELNAPHCGMHTVWGGAEQLVRSTYYARRKAREDWKIDPKTAIYTDISGITWSAVSAFAGAGLRYAGIMLNPGFRISQTDRDLPTFFRWMAPNGKDSLICWHQTGYCFVAPASWTHPFDGWFFDESRCRETEEWLDKFIEKRGDVAYDLLPICNYCDREIPRDVVLTICRSMNKKWAYPQLAIGLPEEIMGYIENNFADTLPVYSGEWPDQWADFASIAPMWFAAKRRAQNDFPLAEALSVLHSAKTGEEYPKESLDEAMWRMCEYDDHCWATSSTHPQKMHRYNLQLVKRESALVADRNVQQILSERIGTARDGLASVWNLLPHERWEQVELSCGQAVDGLTNQQLPDGRVITEPVDLPSFGAKPVKLGGLAEKGSLLTGECFDTPFYRVHLNRETQRIDSIILKHSGEELLDPTAEYALGEFIYVNDASGKFGHGENGKDMISCEIPKCRHFEVERGKLATVVTRVGFEEQMAANVTIRVIFYEYKKDIDIQLKYENAVSLIGDAYDRYHKNIFFAFPLKMDKFHFRTETACGSIDERTDRIPVNNTDFVVAHNWVAVENEERGIALFTREAPVFHLGGIHYNEFSVRQRFDTSHIYLYAASNRCNQLNYVRPEDCQADLHVSLLPYDGAWNDQLPQWSLEKLYTPRLGGPLPETQSLLSLNADNVRLLALKPCDDQPDALVARFSEVCGRKTSVCFELPFSLASAEKTNLIEEATGEYVQVNGHVICFDIEPYSYVTLKIRPEGIAPIHYKAGEKDKVCNIFTSVNENTTTLVCFEKKGCEKAACFDVFAAGEHLMSIPNETYRIQYFEVDRTDLKDIEIIPQF